MKSRSKSLETRLDLKSQHMGIVCVAVNPVRNEFATNSVDGRICIRSTQNGRNRIYSGLRHRIHHPYNPSWSDGSLENCLLWRCTEIRILLICRVNTLLLEVEMERSKCGITIQRYPFYNHIWYTRTRSSILHSVHSNRNSFV